MPDIPSAKFRVRNQTAWVAGSFCQKGEIVTMQYDPSRGIAPDPNDYELVDQPMSDEDIKASLVDQVVAAGITSKSIAARWAVDRLKAALADTSAPIPSENEED